MKVETIKVWKIIVENKSFARWQKIKITYLMGSSV